MPIENVDNSGNLHVVVESGDVDLPTGAATSAKQDAQTSDLDAIKTATQGADSDLDTVLTRLTSILAALAAGLPAALGAGGGLKVDGSGTALPVGDGSGPLTVDGTVTDRFCTIAGVGQKTAGGSAAVTSGVTGAGYVTVLNTDSSAAAYLGTGTVDNTKFLLPAGASITWALSDITTLNCFSSGSPVLSWSFLQVA